MKNRVLTTSHLAAINAFAVSVADARGLPAVSVTPRFARRFDKIISLSDKGETVLFFVDVESGNIYLPKNPNQPNERHWFGTLATAFDLFDFTQTPPVPLFGASVKVEGHYGGYKHYVPTVAGEPGFGVAEKEAEDAKALAAITPTVEEVSPEPESNEAEEVVMVEVTV